MVTVQSKGEALGTDILGRDGKVLRGSTSKKKKKKSLILRQLAAVKLLSSEKGVTQKSL